MGKILLRRYTNLVATIHMLRQRVVTLLNPQLWDDRNDAFGIGQYQAARDAKSVLALCFAEQHETCHHWKVFSSGIDGVCLEFDKARLLQAFATNPTVRSGMVAYREISALKQSTLEISELPFVKRFPYQDEREFRIIYEDMTEELTFKDFSIGLDCIQRVNLSPWMPKPLADSVRATIRSIPGCETLKINRSTLIENDQWKKCLSQAV